MSLTNFPNGITSFGVPVLGAGVQVPSSTGTYFFVHSGTGSSANDGKTPTYPLATIDQAVNKCTADKGDVIVVMPGHAESVSAAAGIDADVAGISIVGLGNGENRPVVSFTTAAGADLDVDAANITIRNIVFKNDIDSQTAMIDVNAAGFTMDSCDLLEGSSKQALIYIDLAEDRATIRNCYIKSIAAGADSGIKIAAAKDRIRLENNVVDGDFSDAGIHNPTSAIATNLVIANNIVRNRQTGDHAIELVSACTGEATGNQLFGDTPGVVFDPGSLFCSNNWENHKIDTQAVPSPLGNNVAGEYWIHTAKATADVTSGSAVEIFTITGGRVLVRAMVAEVTTVLSGTTETLKYQSNPTTGTTTDLCATLDVGGDEAGSLYSLPDAPGTALIASKSGGVRVSGNAIVVAAGAIEAISSADLTGSIKHDIWWRPLDPGARLVAA